MSQHRPQHPGRRRDPGHPPARRARSRRRAGRRPQRRRARAARRRRRGHPAQPRAAPTRSAAAGCCSTAPTPAWASRRWPGPRFYDLDHRRRRLLREDRPAALARTCSPPPSCRPACATTRPSAAASAPIEESLRQGSTIAVKTPAQIAEVAKAAHDLDGITQMVMTTGTSQRPRPRRHPPGPLRAGGPRGAARPADPGAVRAARPTSRTITDLYDAGARSIGIHVESLDDDVRRRWMPGKGIGADGRVPRRLGARRSASSAGTRSRPTCSSGSARTPTSWSPAPRS